MGRSTRYPVGVELAGTARGQTVVDVRERTGESELHGTAHRATVIDVVTELDAGATTALFLRTITPPSTEVRTPLVEVRTT